MMVFILCTGRCGSKTFINACKYIDNFSSAHETKGHAAISEMFGDERFNYPDNHIEADNRLSWFLGDLDKRFKKDTFYVHLIRNRQETVNSYNHRWGHVSSIIKAFAINIIRIPVDKLDETQKINVCELYYDTVNNNIEHFLKNKENKMKVCLETIKEDFVSFWENIGAIGDLHSAIKELGYIQNGSKIVESFGSSKN
jgi:hypothetical protein